MIIRRIAPMSAAKVGATLYALIGFLFGILASLAALGGIGLGQTGSPYAAFFGVGAIIILPIVYGCLGFIFSLISALLYNVAAKWTGGLALEAD